jgi:hypothetical protein
MSAEMSLPPPAAAERVAVENPEHPLIAAYLLLVSLLLGVTGNLLFYQNRFGVNVAVFAALVPLRLPGRDGGLCADVEPAEPGRLYRPPQHRTV